MSIEWSMIASHGVALGATWFSAANPNRSVQLITEVKWGTQRSDKCPISQSSCNMRGTARKDTTACRTNTIHTVRVWVAS